MPDCTAMWWWWRIWVIKLNDSANYKLGPCDFDLACFNHKEQDPPAKDRTIKYNKLIFKEEMAKWIKTFLSISIVSCTFVQYSVYIWENCMKISYSLKGGCQSEGVKSDLGIYELRMLSRETLFWTNFLNKCSAPLSRSAILHSNSCNCSSLQTTAFFL